LYKMANVRKRISELTALNSASLDTVIVGVDNGTTYKIELDVLADAVSNRVNTLDRERLQSLESVTSSFETKGRSVVSGSSQLTSSFDIRYVVSGSITQTTWDNIANKPAGIVSQSTDLSSLNTFTASISTASLVTSISNLNTFTASQSTSSLVDRLNTIESVSGSWITESETGSFLTNLSGAISSSAQITAFGFISSSTTINTSSFATTGSNSFNGNQNITGSLTVTNGNVIASQITANTSSLYLTSGSNLYVQNNGIVEITGSLIATSITGSIASTNGVISGSSQLTTSFPSKTTGSWTVPAGTSTRSFTVDWNHSYQMWVIGNIPNGIISWNANVNVTNANVPIVGSQYGWYYAEGGALVLTDIPEQIVGVNGAISTATFSTTTSNTFEFGITNNSGITQTINYGYIKIS
jgi:hypothetical protein